MYAVIYMDKSMKKKRHIFNAYGVDFAKRYAVAYCERNGVTFLKLEF